MINSLKQKLSKKRGIDGYTYGFEVKRKSHHGVRRFLTEEVSKQLIVLVAFMAVGTVIGAVVANFLGEGGFSDIFAGLYYYINSGFESNAANADFTESLLKYGKVVICIWLLGFVPKLVFLSVIIVLVQGISLGFTTALLVRGFGTEGVFYAAVLYLPQNIVFIPTFIFAAVAALQYAKRGERAEGTVIQTNGFSSYALCFLIILAATIAVSVFEWMVTPWLFGLVG